MFWFWLLVMPALLLSILGLLREPARTRYIRQRLQEPVPDRLPPASVIVPVKGLDEGLKRNLAALAAQEYPDFELIVASRRAADIPPGVLPDGCVVVLAGELADPASEKIQNLRAAVRAARRFSEIFAFADSDGVAPRGWLRALATPLSEPGAGASTGYRWYAPEHASFGALVRSVWNSFIAGRMGPGDAPFAWGGATGIRRNVFFDSGVLNAWEGAVSDDYELTFTVRRAGLRVVYAPGATVASVDAVSFADFFSWASRQLTITRVLNPGLWRLSLFAHLVYCGSMAACVAAAASGRSWAVLPLAVQLSAGMYKGWSRTMLSREATPDHATWFARYGYTQTLWVPLVTWIWLATMIWSARSDSIHWRGRTYRLRRPARSN